MEISSMKLEDYEQIKDRLEEYDDFWTERILRKELESETSTYIVIKEKSEILGFAGIWFSPVDCQITNIVVKKSHRKQGIGSKLLEKLIEIAKETPYYKNFERKKEIYKIKYKINNLLKNVFSVKNEYINNKKKKVIKILGIKN